MSRNLKGGAKKGFNFAAFAEEGSDSDEVTMMPPPKAKAEESKSAPSKTINIGTTGTTLNTNDHSDHKAAKKKPNFNLAIDTEEINKQFNYGGEHGSLLEEEAMAKLENDI
jgi:hypothetical protein